jgi:hypothetical protein
MKKILIVILSLMLVGCDTKGAETYWEYDNNKSLEDKIDTWLDIYTDEEKNIDLILDRLDRIERQVEFNELDYQQFIDAWFNFFLNGEYDKARLDGWSYDYDIDKHEFCYYDNGKLVNCETVLEDMS